MSRSVFFVSDSTGITVDALASSLLSQFDQSELVIINAPFIDEQFKLDQLIGRIQQASIQDQHRPIIFSTLIDNRFRSQLAQSQGVLYDFFETYIGPLETELQQTSLSVSGRAHGLNKEQPQKIRIDAINYALKHDDGGLLDHLDISDIIIIGVSRSGKTPVSLYLAMQFGEFAANFPLTEEDLELGGLPKVLKTYKQKLFGLYIQPERLNQIRMERKPNSRYASLKQCKFEAMEAMHLFDQYKIPFIDTTRLSIEETATRVIHQANLTRRIY